MNAVFTFLAWWFALSIPSTLAFCWLLRSGRVGFIEDRSEFDRGWGPRK